MFSDQTAAAKANEEIKAWAAQTIQTGRFPRQAIAEVDKPIFKDIAELAGAIAVIKTLMLNGSLPLDEAIIVLGDLAEEAGSPGVSYRPNSSAVIERLLAK